MAWEKPSRAGAGASYWSRCSLQRSYRVAGTRPGPPGSSAGTSTRAGEPEPHRRVLIFRFLFLGDQPRPVCKDAADLDDNGSIDVSDGVGILSYLFLRAPLPGPPQRGCWFDLKMDALDCGEFPVCRPSAVILVCDRSGSMREAMKFSKLQEAARDAVSQLSDEDQFAIFFFDDNLVKFPSTGIPADATSDARNDGIAFIDGKATGHASCGKPALFQALVSANQSRAARKQIVYLSDGFTACSNHDPTVYAAETLAEVKTGTPGRSPSTPSASVRQGPSTNPS